MINIRVGKAKGAILFLCCATAFGDNPGCYSNFQPPAGHAETVNGKYGLYLNVYVQPSGWSSVVNLAVQQWNSALSTGKGYEGCNVVSSASQADVIVQSSSSPAGGCADTAMNQSSAPVVSFNPLIISRNNTQQAASVLEHEFGHVLGLADSPLNAPVGSTVMNGFDSRTEPTNPSGPVCVPGGYYQTSNGPTPTSNDVGYSNDSFTSSGRAQNCEENVSSQEDDDPCNGALILPPLRIDGLGTSYTTQYGDTDDKQLAIQTSSILQRWFVLKNHRSSQGMTQEARMYDSTAEEAFI